MKIELPFHAIKVNADKLIFGIDYGSNQYYWELHMRRGSDDPYLIPVALSTHLHEVILIDALSWWKDAWGRKLLSC